MSTTYSDRMNMIGQIRNDVRWLYDAARFEVVKEILCGIHPDNFSGVPTATVERIWKDLSQARTRALRSRGAVAE